MRKSSRPAGPLKRWMAHQGVDEEAFAARVRSFGIECSAGHVRNVANFYKNPSKDVALAFEAATGGEVTADAIMFGDRRFVSVPVRASASK